MPSKIGKPRAESSQSGHFFGSGTPFSWEAAHTGFERILATHGQRVNVIRVTETVDDDGNITDVTEHGSTPDVHALVNEVAEIREELARMGAWELGDLECYMDSSESVKEHDILEWRGKQWKVVSIFLPPLVDGRYLFQHIRGVKIDAGINEDNL